MKNRKIIKTTATFIGLVSICVSLIGALCFDGIQETIITRVAGILLVASAIYWRYDPKSDELKDGRRRLSDSNQNWASLLAILFAVITGYLIYLSPQSMANRKAYIALAAILMSIPLILTYFPPRSLMKKR